MSGLMLPEKIQPRSIIVKMFTMLPFSQKKSQSWSTANSEQSRFPVLLLAKKLSKVSISTFVIYWMILVLHNAFLGPLSNIPGPRILKFFSRLFVLRREPPGTNFKKLKEWQNQYGRVVRIGPNTIAISNKHMLQQVLLHDDLPKGPAYRRIEKLGNTMFFTDDKLLHRKLRRIISPAFSTKYIKSLEPYILSSNKSFLKRIDNDIKKCKCNVSRNERYGIVDIWKVLNYLMLDIIGETAFGQSFGLLENNDHVVPRTIAQTLETISYISASPIFGLIKAAISFSDVRTANNKMQEFMKSIIMERLHGGDEVHRNDILQILIDSQKAHNIQDKLTADAIAQETIVFLIAGSETTSGTIGFALIELLKNPQKLNLLRDEIDQIKLEQEQALLCHHQLKNLPYLNGVINETMRLNFIAPGGIERKVDTDMVLGGHLFVPEGTIVQCNIHAVQRDPDYWPKPNEFIPERWLAGSDIPADHEAFFPFSAGSRICIGNAFALHEMRVTLANLIKSYDIVAIPEELQASDERRAFVTMSLKYKRFMVQMKRREQ
ncbi:cytochrome P450 [Phascolomyces articulosus]|uniref:Cytochrome P450 n=1 Tax=Phascolomyces articulosus TaxID=60185 RepID=A0AAD5JPC0_9FUNG|nr:cytochrome P450 [Phascolomyces articulosus]